MHFAFCESPLVIVRNASTEGRNKKKSEIIINKGERCIGVYIKGGASSFAAASEELNFFPFIGQSEYLMSTLSARIIRGETHRQSDSIQRLRPRVEPGSPSLHSYTCHRMPERCPGFRCTRDRPSFSLELRRTHPTVSTVIHIKR